MIKVLDVCDAHDALRYFTILHKNYTRYLWNYVKDHNDPRSLGEHFSLKTMTGFGLQTIYSDPTFPYHCDIDPHDEGPEYFKDTPLVFGFFKDMKEKFPNVYRSFLMNFQPGDYIGKYTAGANPHTRIFIPIITNGTSWLHSYSDSRYSVVPEVGKIYAVDMFDRDTYISINNEGSSPISFIMFSSK